METLAEEEQSEVLMANVSPDNLIVVKHTEELRVIDVQIQSVKVIATVDDGLQIKAFDRMYGNELACRSGWTI